MNEILIDILEFFVIVLSLIAATIIIYGSIQAFYKLVLFEFRYHAGKKTNKLLAYERIKNDFGHKLSMGLEFLLAGDLIALIFVRTSEQLIMLAVLVVIRIAVNYFLEKDMEDDQI